MTQEENTTAFSWDIESSVGDICKRTYIKEAGMLKSFTTIRLCLTLLGVAANIFTVFTVKGSPPLRRQSYTIYITLIMIFDNIVLVAEAFNSIAVAASSFVDSDHGWNVDKIWISVPMCVPKILSFVSNAITLWITVALSFNGLVALTFPMQHLVNCTRRKAWLTCGLIILFAACAYTPSSVLLMGDLNIYTSKLFRCEVGGVGEGEGGGGKGWEDSVELVGGGVESGFGMGGRGSIIVERGGEEGGGGEQHAPPELHSGLPYLTSCEAFHRWSLKTVLVNSLLTGPGPLVLLVLCACVQYHHLRLRSEALHALREQDELAASRIKEQNKLSRTFLLLITFRALLTAPIAVYQALANSLSDQLKYITVFINAQNYGFKFDMVLEITTLLSLVTHMGSFFVIISSNKVYFRRFLRIINPASWKSCISSRKAPGGRGRGRRRNSSSIRRDLQLRRTNTTAPGSNICNNSCKQLPVVDINIFEATGEYAYAHGTSSQSPGSSGASSRSSRKDGSLLNFSKLEVIKEDVSRSNSLPLPEHQQLARMPSPVPPGAMSEDTPPLQDDDLLVPGDIFSTECPEVIPTERLLKEVVKRLSYL